MKIREKIRLSIAKEFTETPGFRHRDDGPNSGEEFLERLLEPRYQQAKQEGKVLAVNFNGTAGYATSFLEAAFGGLARKYGVEQVLASIEFICDEEPSLDYEVTRYIKEAVATPQTV